jgi:hypothetical protein
MNNELHIKNWIAKLIQPRDQLGGMPICPYAKNTDYTICETTIDNINPPPWQFDLYIFVITNDIGIEQLSKKCVELEQQYPSMVFLPDHKDRDTFINGQQTNNGKLNLILCQWADDLHAARIKLAKTTYYDHWDDDYLKEILKIENKNDCVD